MINFDPKIDEIRRKAIEKLLARRKALQAQADELAAMPASYGITGSVSVTNHSIDDLKKQITAIDLQIKELLVGEPAGISLSYPNYRWRGWL